MNREKRNIEAIHDITKAIKHEPDNPVFYQMRGVFYYENNNADKAKSDYIRIIELNPSTTNYIKRAYFYRKIKRQ